MSAPGPFVLPRIADGMSLRDWFAGQALSGLMGSGKFGDDAVGYAYYLADEMLAAREQGK